MAGRQGFYRLCIQEEEKNFGVDYSFIRRMSIIYGETPYRYADMVFNMMVSAAQVRGIPRYVRISEKLRQEIAQGVLKPGDQLPSFTQTRATYGISQATWEKIHATLELDGLVVREPGRGVFVASRQTRRLNRTKTNCIGLVGYGFREAGSSTYWAAVLSGIQTAAMRSGHNVMLLSPEDKMGWEQADGIITYGWNSDEVQSRVPETIPTVFLFSGPQDAVAVCADETAAMHQLTSYLVRLGHRRIAYLHGGGLTEESPRMTGYLSALREAGISPLKNWRRALVDGPGYGAEFIRSGQETMRYWLRHGWAKNGCSALLVHNDEAAIGAMEALHEAEMRVPGDVSVAGFDGLDIGAYYSPRLTTMQIPLQQIGARAAMKLLDLIELQSAFTAKEIAQESERMPGEVLSCILQERESCALHK